MSKCRQMSVKWLKRVNEGKITMRPPGLRLALLFSYENLGSMAWEFSLKCETLRCENSTLATICPLLPSVALTH